MTWIPVGERLPENGSGDLIVYDGEDVFIANIYDGHWSRDFGDGIIDPVFGVTHWQPLPEPPGKEGE